MIFFHHMTPFGIFQVGVLIDLCLTPPPIHSDQLKPTIIRSRRTSVAHPRQLERCPCKKDLRLNAFFPRSIREWNSLPENVVTAESSAQFCQLLTELAE